MIHILTPDVFNRIAAGEVVDRPYSVVKELVENAVDAGASEIKIEIEEGGKKRIRVTDNGCGIEKSDLKAAFYPHATSKLQSAADLEHIATLGFRGEAIASIAAVSRMKIASKTKDGEGWSLVSDGGVLGEIEPAAGADGTCVTVDGLFSHTPARLKFLRSDSQEEGDVSGMVARFLLSRPEIAFTYLVNGKTRYQSFGDGLESAAAIVYGASALENCFEVNAEKHGLRLRGYLGNQNFYKPNRSYQSFFVNGRYVTNQTLSSAVANAYSSYLMKRQYPFYVLFLDVPPEIVDVNVHPNKADVRFADNQVIYGCVYSIVSAILDGNSRALEYLAPMKEKTASGSGTFTAASAAFSAPAPSLQEKTKPSVPSPGEMSYEEAKKELQFVIPPLGGDRPYFGREARRPELRSPAPGEPSQAEKEDVFEENRRELFERERRAKQEKVDPSALVYKGELFRTYLLYEGGDEVYLIDQHAAHERLLFNKLTERLEKREPLSQPLLLPYTRSLTPQEFAFLSKNLEILRSFGFEIEEFGTSSVKISAVPVDLFGMDADAFLSEMLSSMETLRAVKLADIVRDRLATMACKAAVKGGDPLTEAEVRALLGEMEGNMGLKCPHGRPACVKIKKSELEKLFKRTV